MNKVLITGAGGFVGGRLALFLAEKDIQVNAMHRPGSSLKEELLAHRNITPTPANLTDLASMEQASKDCDTIFHLAAFAQPWAKDNETFYNVNVQGTINVLEAAKDNKVNRVVLTSTAGTFGPQVDDSMITERLQSDKPPFTEYERTKKLANEKAMEYVKKGMDIVIVSPTRVFGPGNLSTSNAVTTLLMQYMQKGIRFVPGNGRTTGNYAFIDDIIEGHYLAAIHGKSGENYILGGENLTYRELYHVFGEVLDKKKKPIGVPISAMFAVSKTMEILGNTIGITPKITPPFVRKYTHNWSTDISKAKTELGYKVTPFKKAVELTADWIRTLG